MNALFKFICLALLVTGAHGESKLPACKGSDATKWNNCFGTSTWSNGDKYVGEWANGKTNGQGVHFLGEGQFKGGKYTGEFKDDKYHGQGSYTHASGETYTGSWKNGKYNGQAVWISANGDKYTGEFKDNKRSGQGVFTFADGRVFLGEWADDQANGRFIKYSETGLVEYSGIFKDNVLITSQYIDPNSFARITQNPKVTAKRQLPDCLGIDASKWNNCFGSWSEPNAYEYEGEWKNGLFDGQGTYHHTADDEWKGYTYVGDYKKHNRHGSGTSTFANGDTYIGEFQDNQYSKQGIFLFADGRIFLGEWADGKANGRFIRYNADGSVDESGIFIDDELITSKYIDPNIFKNIPKNLVSQAVSTTQLDEIEFRERQVELEMQRLAEERQQFEAEKAKRELAKKSQQISITASVTQPDSNGVVTLTIQTNTDTSSLKVNGEELGGKVDGNYIVKKVARVGQETKFNIVGVDVHGNTDSKIIAVVRKLVDSKTQYSQLNVSNVKQQPAKDAVAIIIGIEKYKRVAKADFANADAQDFYDYASRALGIKQENIKLLIDEDADDLEILQAFQNWLPLKVKKGKTDVYVFFSGHGYPSEDGKSLYFLPYGVDKNFMERTAVKQNEVISALQTVQPKSVTMFIDSCYSGQTRGGDTLVASAKPIALKHSEASYPPEFTVITASNMDQISWSSPDLKHGIFSYYLMKGMEGEADLNKDGKISVAEMQEYLSDMVGRQAMGMNRKQHPQLFGDPEKVLVGR
jgi:hypothetical protein